MILRGSIQRGKEFLEERYGEKWYNQIDLESLDMSSSVHCLIGQLAGWYNFVFPVKTFFGRYSAHENHSGRYYGFMGDTWEVDKRLTSRWKKEIRQLRREEVKKD
jgi:hypothetical protein